VYRTTVTLPPECSISSSISLRSWSYVRYSLPLIVCNRLSPRRPSCCSFSTNSTTLRSDNRAYIKKTWRYSSV
jgi:hypothetical protein